LGKIKDLTGMKFGRLTVISFNKINRFHQATWNVVCNCGNASVAVGSAMLSGITVSCGCQQYDNFRKKRLELSGMRFGRLVAIEITGKKNNAGRYYWRCICDCGKETVVTSSSLVSGGTLSCGCYLMDRIIESRTTHGLSGTKEYAAASSQRRREMKRDLDSKWTTEMECEIHKFFPRCILCGSYDNLSVDHVFPLSKGNGLDPSNAVVLCRSCNSKKRDKYPHELPRDDYFEIMHRAEDFRMYWYMYHGEEF
jgi:hypothetical protein